MFCMSHKLIMHYPYAPTWGKDMKIMKELVGIYGLDAISKLVRMFFNRLAQDKFLQQTGASIGIFKSQIPKLILELSKVEPDKSYGTLSTRSLEIIK